MPCEEILAHLCNHGCQDVTDQLNLAKCSQYAVAGGSFGDVFSGFLHNGDPVAIKCLRIMVGVDDSEGRKQLRRAAHEIYVWSKCKHPNVLELIGIARYQNRISMVSPWMEQGNLNWFLSRHPDVDRYAMCAQIAAGVAHLHSSDIIHGDIKPLNILVSNDHVPKLADFGTSILTLYTLQFTRGSGSRTNVTVRYTAPEILREETKLSAEGDVYALGMTILETITETLPYAELAEPVVLTRVLIGTPPTRHEQKFSRDDEQAYILWKLLTHCWDSDPLGRPTATEIASTLRAISHQPTAQRNNTDEAMTVDLSSPQTPVVPLGKMSSNDLEPGSALLAGQSRASSVPSGTELEDSCLTPSLEKSQSATTLRKTRFKSRAVGGLFQDLASTSAARNIINEWHKSIWNDRPLDWTFSNEGSAHDPCWKATPIIMDEPHPEYEGRDKTRRGAQNKSATKIMNSGFC
ncbi:hypothetical protein RhiXN_11810 [Rhizoctonia solani]|nr:uncharacterized protein RhiXN_11810 [Rhizoctonia solani]QRW24898.1 hypothetical protein RhiXN_11810 [Rhizoctonia solani]